MPSKNCSEWRPRGDDCLKVTDVRWQIVRKSNWDKTCFAALRPPYGPCELIFLSSSDCLVNENDEHTALLLCVAQDTCP
jgi:hypothetical protein